MWISLESVLPNKSYYRAQIIEEKFTLAMDTPNR